MKTRDDILQVLGGLDTSDRQWIVNRLSPTTRAVLLGGSQTQAPALALVDPKKADGVATKPTAVSPLSNENIKTTAQTRLANASAGSVATLLGGEPAWVIHALLQASRWAWRDELLRSFSATLRNDIARLDTAGVCYADRLVDGLVVEAAQLVVVDSAVEKPSPFEALVAKLGTKFTRHRQSMRA